MPKTMIRFKIINKLALGLMVFFYPLALQAVEITPFHTQNQSPVVQIYGLPSIGSAAVVPYGKAEGKIILDHASNYVNNSNSRENILLDGESTRVTLEGRYGIARGFEGGVEIPFVVLGGGFLDSFIEGYHNTFGFPRGGRDQAPRNRLLYQYRRDGQERLHLDTASYGLGDIRLKGAWQLYQKMEGQPRAAALRASLKLPTGDSDQLHGSGSTDFSLWVTASDGYKLGLGHLTFFGAAGIMAMTDGQVLRDQQRHWVGFGGLGGGWSPLRWIAFKIQANAHTSFYRESDLRELNAVSAQLTMGGTLALSDRTTLDLGITEDIIVATAPDVVFHLNLRLKF
jgi:hypothetical protein